MSAASSPSGKGTTQLDYIGQGFPKCELGVHCFLGDPKSGVSYLAWLSALKHLVDHLESTVIIIAERQAFQATLDTTPSFAEALKACDGSLQDISRSQPLVGAGAKFGLNRLQIRYCTDSVSSVDKMLIQLALEEDLVPRKEKSDDRQPPLIVLDWNLLGREAQSALAQPKALGWTMSLFSSLLRTISALGLACLNHRPGALEWLGGISNRVTLVSPLEDHQGDPLLNLNRLDSYRGGQLSRSGLHCRCSLWDPSTPAGGSRDENCLICSEVRCLRSSTQQDPPSYCFKYSPSEGIFDWSQLSPVSGVPAGFRQNVKIQTD